MADIFNMIIYKPLYNGFVYLISIVPGHDLGLAIIILTILVKVLLLPLAHRQSRSQAKMKEIEPEMRKIQTKHKDDKQEQARKTMELYKQHGVNPFSGCFLVLLQLPVIIALYWVFLKGLKDGVNIDLLYTGIAAPETIQTVFLGLVDLMARSWPLALLAAATQFFQMKLAMPALPPREAKKSGETDLKEEFSRSMNTQFRYILPGMIFVLAYSIPAAVSLYWSTSNLFSIVHELFVKKEARKLISNQNNSHES